MISLKKKKLEKNNRHQRGSVLLFAVLISTIVLSMGLAISQIIVTELKIGSDFSNSLVAYYAARSGLELGLLKIKNNDYTDTSGTLSNGASYYAKMSCESLSAAGSFSGVRRDLPYSYTLVPTVTIGTQTWMKCNLDVGTMITGSTSQTNNGVVEKYCYNNDPANCTTYGGLYQWNEIMQYSTTEGVQGICPAGFHLPTDAEWKTLEMYLGMTQAEADAVGWRGTDQGTKLKSGGSSGFNALFGGARFPPDEFYDIGAYSNFWTSSQFDAENAWRRIMHSPITTVGRTNVGYTKPFGLSARCLKN